MKIKVGNKRLKLSLISLGFIVFLGVFLVATKNSNFFRANADTKSLTCGQSVPITYVPASIRQDASLKQRDQTTLQNIFNQVCNQQQQLYKQYNTYSGTQSLSPHTSLRQVVITDNINRFDKSSSSVEALGYTILGRFDYSSNTLYINAKQLYAQKDSSSTIFHEITHSFQPNYRDATIKLASDGTDPYAEGVTEYLTEKIYPGSDSAYTYFVQTMSAISALLHRADTSDNTPSDAILDYTNNQSNIAGVFKILSKPNLGCSPAIPSNAFSRINTAMVLAYENKSHESIVGWINSLCTTNKTTTTTNKNPAVTKGVNVLYITSKSNCPYCAAQTTIVNNLKKQYATNVSNGTLTFTNDDYDSNPYYATIIAKGGVPTIIIQANGKDLGRYSGSNKPQSQSALAGKIQEALNSLDTSGDNSNNTTPTPQENPIQSGSVEFLYITSKSSCPNCAAQTTIINNLKKQYTTNVSNGTLKFTNDDFESNPYYATIIAKGDIPTIIIRANGTDLGRYSGGKIPQSQSALAGKIQEALNSLGTGGSAGQGNGSGTSNGFNSTPSDGFTSLTFTQDGCNTNASATINPKYLTGTDPVTTVDFTTQGKTQTAKVTNGSATTIFQNICNDGPITLGKASIPSNPTPTPGQTSPPAQPEVSSDGYALRSSNKILNLKSLLLKNIVSTVSAAGSTDKKAVGRSADGKAIVTATQNNNSGPGTSGTLGSTTTNGTCNQPDSNDSFGFTCMFKSFLGLSKKGSGDPINSRLANIINLLLGLASVAMAFGAVWSGLLYIFSMGNEEQTKKAKSNFIMVLIGLALLLASFTIVKVITSIISGGNIVG